jgi:hypothetical protein
MAVGMTCSTCSTKDTDLTVGSADHRGGRWLQVTAAEAARVGTQYLGHMNPGALDA